MSVKDFTVEEVPRKSVKNFIEKHHYSHNVNGIQHLICFGLFKEGSFGLPKMIGAMLYAIPSMPNTAKKYYPPDPSKCIELRRLVCIDDTPTNTESYFIGQTFKLLKKLTDYKVVVSFADGEYGHTGVIYKATNFEYCGKTAPGRTLIVDGVEYHARSLNQPIKPYSREIRKRYDAKDPNIYWKHTKQKYIYVYFLDRKAKKKFDFESIKQ